MNGNSMGCSVMCDSLKNYIATKIVKAMPATKAQVYDAQHRPYTGDGSEEGYHVFYPGNPGAPYDSWCPKDVFEAANRLCNAMNFGLALEALKMGKRVARQGWNGNGMWLALSPGCVSLPAERFWTGPNREYAKSIGGAATVLPCISVKTATGEILPGWLASQTDMLADDWVLVD